VTGAGPLGPADEGLLTATIGAVQAPDPAVLAAARERQDRLTKPRGSLGVLEDVSVQLCGISGICPPPVPGPAAVAVFAADHGVHAQGVSPWPQEVSGQMVANFLAGGAAVNAFAGQAGAAVVVVDVGLATSLDGLIPPGAAAESAAQVQPGVPRLLQARVRSGTADLSQGPAMTWDQAVHALQAGITVAHDLAAAGYRCLLTGDMGIANTTASAVLIAAFTGHGAADVTGRGTGIDDAMHAHKIQIVGSALDRHARVIGGSDPIEILAAAGGLEHAAIAGYILGAAASGVPVVLDGVIAGAAALVARALAPEVMGFCLAGHRSAEPGHTLALSALGLTPLVDLELRLGEGTGAVLALPLIQAAAAALREMATFDAAGVTDKGD
jgi:nicotinate-nucleotide--dimethylbenzimidazole phosphoribosyltransferase